MKYAWAGVLTIATLTTISAEAASDSDGERWWSHVRVLADDKLEGRDTGSPGHRKAAEYVAGEFMIVFGLDESDLKNDVNAVAGPAGLPVLPDPEPKRNIFIRSDQYSFVRQGIPSLMLMVGYEKGTKEEATLMTWLKDRYHAPSDDLSQPVDKPAAGAFNAFVAKLITRVANRDSRPQFAEMSFFKRFAH
jgi:Zn-dependent M28 family amino/carboxypeptidase